MLERISSIFANVGNTFERLSDRERKLVALTGIAVLVFITFLIIMAVNSSLNNLRENTATLKENNVMVNNLRTRYNEAKKSVESSQTLVADNKANLTAEVGSLASKLAIEITQINQAGGKTDKKTGILEEPVKVEIRRVELPALINFLEQLEQKNSLFYVDDMLMRRRYDNKQQLDVSFKVTTVKLASEG